MRGAVPPPDASGKINPVGPLRLVDVVKRDSVLISGWLDSLRNTPEARMKRALTLAPSDWMPTAADRARHADELWRAQGFDKIFQNIPRVNLVSVPMGAIWRALGIIEDVTPRIKYTLLRTDSVSVRVYNLQAELVAVVVDGSQRPGVYDFNWNMLGSDGKRVSYGDYIAEVVVGQRLLLRKRIEVP